MKRILNHIFIDGLSGMASGLFATLIIGTILGQVGVYVGGTAGGYMIFIASAAKALTGAGIGVGIACKYQAPILVAASAAVAGTGQVILWAHLSHLSPLSKSAYSSPEGQAWTSY